MKIVKGLTRQKAFRCLLPVKIKQRAVKGRYFACPALPLPVAAVNFKKQVSCRAAGGFSPVPAPGPAFYLNKSFFT
jgi:hypothetical protein